MDYDAWKTTPPEDDCRPEPDDEPDEEKLIALRDRLERERRETEED